MLIMIKIIPVSINMIHSIFKCYFFNTVLFLEKSPLKQMDVKRIKCNKTILCFFFVKCSPRYIHVLCLNFEPNIHPSATNHLVILQTKPNIVNPNHI